MNSEHITLDDVAAAIGGAGGGTDGTGHGIAPKMATAEPCSESFCYLLASYVFDLTRKQFYFFKAFQDVFAQHVADGVSRPNHALFTQIDGHNRRVEEAAAGCDGDDDWKERAEELEKIVRELYAEIEPEYTRLFNEALRQQP